ncbi:hypothetical protein [Natronobacterium gregoryi]|uniref:Uncharacterized protein n=2 Tax=Natronobacterium gregoryi TaxID=44930 RepID=L0AL88_NATGS|nr:hypothetical protein [Natronobacterium gregoryi]AFZ74561.1 hypothetical protein Natgr_3442 [Natronobacterium gregoryi SP2]ELY72369.1 hypothetical protein C490_03458 [Natronobacterium gregoryi SP2]PLK21697.1 hypothetical protein CYV19_02350 [Natronobacterium gregoryi SP2]SFI96201.1 hypothetical protein SAMN05443661_110144 [Natronobacterium gregoryi]
MSSEVNWVLDQLGDVVESVAEDYSLESGDPVNVIRVNRTDSEVYDGSDPNDMTEPLHKRKEDLERGVFIGARLADRDPTPVGTEYDHRLEAVVSLRIEGLTTRGGNYGHVDPAGENGVPFDVLTRRVRRTLLESRSYPDTGTPYTAYHDHVFTNEASLSAAYRDFYHYEIDIALRGYEELP